MELLIAVGVAWVIAAALVTFGLARAASQAPWQAEHSRRLQHLPN